MEESVKACSPEIRPRIAMGVEPISIPLRKTTARSSEALRMMETGPVGAFSGCQVVENALSNDEDELPLPSSTSGAGAKRGRSEEHTSELQSLMRISYAVFCLKKKKKHKLYITTDNTIALIKN